MVKPFINKINISIRQRIYLSFFLLVVLFAINAIITITTLNGIRNSSLHLSQVVDPSLESLIDFRKMMQESKIYSTSWVFLPYNIQDRDGLKKLQDEDYPLLKEKINSISSQWKKQQWKDSVNNIFSGFDKIIIGEKSLMQNLHEQKDYNDPGKKIAAEKKLEAEILPLTTKLLVSLNAIRQHWLSVRKVENDNVSQYSSRLRIVVIFLAISIACLGFALSIFMTRRIIGPINKIRNIINDLGNGITTKAKHTFVNNEIGEMISSVNNLSEKLHNTAAFASEIGNRNFDTHFEPISPKDTLGKALLAMRDNLKSSDDRLNEAQHIAKLGSWEWDVVNNILYWSDELYRMYEVDKNSFKPTYENFLFFIHPEDKEQVIQQISTAFETHVPFSHEHRIITANNVIKYMCAQGRVILNSEGKVIKMYGTGQDITETKKAQKEIEAINRELNILFNSIDEIFFSVNMITSKVIQISPTCEKIYGYSPSEFMADHKLWFQLIHPDDRNIISNEDTLLHMGEQVNNQYRIIRKDKTIRWVENKIVPTLDEDGLLIRVDGITRDITERKNAEIALRESEEFNKGILSSLSSNIAVIDKSGRILAVNKNWEDFSIANGQVNLSCTSKGNNYLNVCKKAMNEGDEIAKQTFEGIISVLNKQSNYFELEYPCHSPAEQRWYVLRAMNFESDSPKVVITHQDITERKKAEEKVEAEKELFRLTIENIPDQIYLKDTQSRFLLCNEPVLECLGVKTIQEAIGKTDYEFFSKEMADDFINEEEEMMRTGKPIINKEQKLIDKETGEISWSIITKVPLKNAVGEIIGLIGINRDITERKKDEQLMKESEAKLEVKNKELEVKNRELEQFAYVASHDLQEPLTTSTSFVKILKKQYVGKLDPKAERYLQYIIQASDRMQMLIKDLLDFSSIGHKKEIGKVDCNNIVEELKQELETDIKQTGTQLSVENLPVIYGYANEIKLLFQNLLINAIKFRKHNTVPTINISAEICNEYWRFAVKDNGIGIDKAYNEKIFVIFQRLHNRSQYPGSGIGLSHCKKIVELHHGKIWVESVPGEGSIFYFTIRKSRENINIHTQLLRNILA